jgi:deazaflavin-dependent oxidoreductase (nitroreductase family)
VNARTNFGHAHAWAYERSEGRLGAHVGGQSVLVLATTGRRTGLERRTPVQFQRLGGGLVLVAAAGGAAVPPAWWRNLEAEPRATVQVGSERWAVRSRTADDDERERLWPELVAANPALTRAEARAGRRLPVVVLIPDAPPG